MPSSASPPVSLAPSLTQHRIWGQVKPEALDGLAQRFTGERYVASATLLTPGHLAARLGWLVSGEVSLQDADLGLSVQLQADDLFGFGATPDQALATWQAVASSACEVAWLPPEALIELCSSQPELLVFFPSVPLAPCVTSA